MTTIPMLVFKPSTIEISKPSQDYDRLTEIIEKLRQDVIRLQQANSAEIINPSRIVQYTS